MFERVTKRISKYNNSNYLYDIYIKQYRPTCDAHRFRGRNKSKFSTPSLFLA